MASQVFDALAAAHPDFAGLSYDIAGSSRAAGRRRDGGDHAMSAWSFTLLLQVADPQASPQFWPWFVATLVKLLIFFTVYMLGVAYLTLAERRISAWIQDRHGPNRVGPQGLFQPLADGLKNMMKEETLPPYANRALFLLAPMLSFVPAMMVWAVIPFAASWASPWGRIDMVLADLPVGFLFILALSSLGVYGIVLAGWSSNNKYALLGGLRSSAQMISYEVAIGMSLIPVLLLSGNVSLRDIVNQQASMHLWNVLTLAVSFFLFLVAAFAETNRLPFDLPEAESELITGYHTEYSAMKFSLFFIAEYANMMTASALIATLFFGGLGHPVHACATTPRRCRSSRCCSPVSSSRSRRGSSCSSSSGSAGRCRASATTSSCRSGGR